LKEKGESMKKFLIEARKKGEKFGEPGELIETFNSILASEEIGNFNPIFCFYKGKRVMVSSKEGDLSDPFRRETSYLKSLYIEV
jgi:hypothetical protein